MKRALRIGYITVDDPNDRRTWSGINYFLLRALREEVEYVVPLGPLRPQPELFVSKVFNALALRLLGKRYNYRDSFRLSRAYARLLRKRIESERLDLLIAPAGLATAASLHVPVPIIHINDRCIAGALDYHKVLSDLIPFSREESLRLEAEALSHTALTVYASDWAADAARKAYPASAAKIQVVPFGANLLTAPAPPTERTLPADPVKLLFLGVYWENKGGPIAYEALLELKRRGIAAQLVVCGCDPPPVCDDPDLVREGFLNKNVAADMSRLEEHLRTADLLVLPTRFEAYGIVFCEAAAYGLPVLATRTGGVPTIVQDGRTGFLFDPSADGKAYAEVIARLIAEPGVWLTMRHRARERFERTLTWSAFVEALLRHASEAGLIKSAR